jgi:hypothetical protein
LIVVIKKTRVRSDPKRHVAKPKVSLYYCFVLVQAKRFDHLFPPCPYLRCESDEVKAASAPKNRDS